MENLERFTRWLDEELAERDWSRQELARQAGKNASQPKISLTLAGKRSLTWDFCAAVAEALDYDPVEVFKIAGLLPEEITSENPGRK